MSFFLTQIAENAISAIFNRPVAAAKSLEVSRKLNMSIFLTQIAENPISATFKIDQLQLQWLDNEL